MNFGPSCAREYSVRELVDLFLANWGPCRTKVAVSEESSGVEAAVLRVDSSLAMAALGWRPVWDAARAVQEAAIWYKKWINGHSNLRGESVRLIEDYTRDAANQGLGWARSP